jgi:hypothetical protein
MFEPKKIAPLSRRKTANRIPITRVSKTAMSHMAIRYMGG